MIGLAVTGLVGALVAALVADIVMPVVGIFLPAGDWASATVTLASAELRIGHFLGALIDFLIVALLIFLVVKYALPAGMADDTGN